MLFVQSLRGLSHTKLEDTKPEHLELSVQALDRLADSGHGVQRGRGAQAMRHALASASPSCPTRPTRGSSS